MGVGVGTGLGEERIWSSDLGDLDGGLVGIMGRVSG